MSSARRFGPPRSTAAWAQERVNGMLQKLPTNHHPDELPKTLTHKWHMHSTFKGLLNGAADEHHSTEDGSDRIPMNTSLDEPVFLKWKRAVSQQERSQGQSRVVPENHRLTSLVNVVPSMCINRKTFTSRENHHGNSLVEFHLGNCQRFGEIERIFLSDNTPGRTWVVVKPFREVPRDEDPYRNYPDLNCRLVQANYEALAVIASEEIIGHVACMKNPAGTFGLTNETISAVGLGSAGWESLVDNA
ncbi:hypothetical protein PTTG_28271 [Puccinia triticina 1-1 BBBD Race 1]|uniref:Uncharacterized protein n=1 Tax=Puccinia triticina (isolate 1-1 / race 1 (BBBD)) TaxID=630390 RepID=A0A180GDT3_PUCT1|nr:hypothetical protein PTTG_28271 [Puccinia triticina 1-1 BBBD Race 1]